MGNSCCNTSISDQEKKDLLLKGVSIYYLKYFFLQEVQDSGLDVGNATVYDLEDLRSDDHGLIRRKGANVVCPRDRQLGAAYVDAIVNTTADPPYTSRANIMLSYCWSYKIREIVKTLATKCETDGLDTKELLVQQPTQNQ